MRKIFLLLLLPLSVAAQRDYSKMTGEFLSGQNKYFNFNGNVLVERQGKIVYQGALGFANYTTQQKLNDSSAFELASVSKQFTAMAVLILQQRGALSIDDNVKKFFPDFPYNNITVKNLLTHTSGIPAYEDQFDKYWDRKKIAFNKDIIPMLIKVRDTLFFAPGSSWKYSNTGFALLASIIEKVSGTSYNDFLMTNIFQPLGMTHTFVNNMRRSNYKIPANYALGYVHSDSLNRYILPDSLNAYSEVYYLDGIVGDGCVNSTTGDLMTWVNSWSTDKLLTRAAKSPMFSPQVHTSPRDSGSYYGFGLLIEPTSEHGYMISHSGGWPGYHTLITRFPVSDETIIILSNNESNAALINAGLESILWGDSLVMPYEHKEVKIDPALLDKYVGKYSAFMTLVFIKKDGKLYRHRDGTPDIELKPESDTKFFYSDGSDRQIEFELDASGKVTKVWFLNSGQKGELKKVQ